MCAGAAGELGAGIALAERAEAERDPIVVIMARLWPNFDGLRADPRFRAIVDHLHLLAERPS